MLKDLLAASAWTKLALLALLTLNVGVYAATGDRLNAMDALCWVLLWIMFELETLGRASPFGSAGRRLVRNVLIAVIVTVFALYIAGGEWLDVGNAVLWFVLVALLELEIRRPRLVLAHPRAYWLATVAVFVGLLALVAVWLYRAAWLEAYDALLWIVAFATLDVDIFRFLQLRKRP